MSSGHADPGNVLRGHKAALHNPNVSEEAKEHSRQEIDRLEKELGLNASEHEHQAGGHSLRESDYQEHEGADDQHMHRVKGGYKATLSNPHTSEEAKSHARAELEKLEEGNGGSYESSGGDQHEHRVLGGYKATLHNPNTSEEAKEKAAQILADAGESV